MLDLVARGAFEQVARFGGIVEIIAQRVGDGFGHHDLGCKMRDGVDVMFAENVFQRAPYRQNRRQRVCWRLHSGPEAGRQIVENNNLFASVKKRQHHMAADIASAARYQNCHNVTPEGNSG